MKTCCVGIHREIKLIANTAMKPVFWSGLQISKYVQLAVTRSSQIMSDREKDFAGRNLKSMLLYKTLAKTNDFQNVNKMLKVERFTITGNPIPLTTFSMM
jgi:hypothetical protein